MKTTLLMILLFACIPQRIFAQKIPPDTCNQAMPEPVSQIHIGDHPVDPIPTRDGCWIFLSVARGGNASGVAVLQRSRGAVTQKGFIYVPGSPFGMVLTHDEKTLIVAAGALVAFLDVGSLISGERDPNLGVIRDSTFNDAIFVNISSDDSYLFVSQEGAASISVIDYKKARESNFKTNSVIGSIPAGYAPLSLVFSPDEKYLYATSQEAPTSYDFPISCKPQNGTSTIPDHREGVVLVIDVEKAKSAPVSSVISYAKAGCNPVRLALSPDGNTAYVSARADGMLMVFDTTRFLSNPAQSFVARIPVGTAPVGVAVVDNGKKIVVANSNRYAGGAADKQTLTVIDASKLGDGAKAVIGSIPAGAFPRQMHLTSDGRILLLSNYNSGSLEIIDFSRVQYE